MHVHVLLQDYSIRELPLADGARVLDLQRDCGTVNSLVCLQVSFGCESSAAQFALVRTLACMCPIVHPQGTLTAEDAVADDTFIWVRHSLVRGV